MAIKNQFTIKDLELFSGIKAHTIRVWEQRYCLLEPCRTGTNIRQYSTQDLKLLLNIAFLYNHGLKISRIAEMEREEICARVRDVANRTFAAPAAVDQLLLATFEMDETRFNKVITRSSKEIGFDQTVEQILFPLLYKVGLLWVTDKVHPAQEHFISNLIRQKLLVAIDAQAVTKNPGAEKYVLFLPEGELHELGLLYVYYLLRKNGHNVLYLGLSVPVNNLEEVTRHYQPDYLYTHITSETLKEDLIPYLNRLAGVVQVKEKIRCSGAALKDLDTSALQEKVELIAEFQSVATALGLR